ncbi:hypothetical protein THRCLA_06782 [Thraustotheca clavata]|uniref:Uncharacterized protein n=1 Tax=Thraustotheca clavata TaxID=74557 RepID=A0A1V9ZJG2_9STRA|nr:hypothetical protein THRCLA_06782 [Thraustotheca clavata]
MADVLDEYSIPLQMIFLEAIGESQVHANPKSQKRHYALHTSHVLNFQGFVAFMQRYRIFPDLITRNQMIQMYSSNERYNQKQMEYLDFISTLLKCAKLIFSGREWDDLYPNVNLKMRLLLLWMDECSQIFLKNGSSLCEARQQATDRVNTAQCVSKSAFEERVPSLRIEIKGMRNAKLNLVELDIIFQRVRKGQVSSYQGLTFDSFYTALGLIASRLYEASHPPRTHLPLFAQEFLLPVIARIDAAIPRNSKAWRRRWKDLCTLREQLLSSSSLLEQKEAEPLKDHLIEEIALQLEQLNELLSSKLDEIPSVDFEHENSLDFESLQELFQETLDTFVEGINSVYNLNQ